MESWGGTWLGTLGVPHYESLTEKYRGKLDKDFAKKAALLTKAMEAKPLPQPSLGRLMSFRMWKMNAAVGFSAADVEHWTAKGWLAPGCCYYYKTTINPLANAVAAAAMGLTRRIMRGIYVGY